jgi:D-alanyl-D-alanine carboxypeptidase
MRMGLVRCCVALWLALMLAIVSPPVRAEAPAPGPREWSVTGGPVAYSAATGHHLTGAFLIVWRARGGMTTFGEPLSEATPDATGRWAQVTERALLTLPPGADPGRLGNAALVVIEPLGHELIADRLDEPAFQPVPEPHASRAAWFPATGHTLANGFLAHWQAHDGATTLGPPLSEEYEEAGRIVQWFERGRLDYDPAAGAIERAALGRAAARAAALIRPPIPPTAGATPLHRLPPLPPPWRLAAWADDGFGLGAAGAAVVLAPVGKGRPLPLGLTPADLTPAAEVGLADGLATVRAALLTDLIDLAAAARARGLTLTVLSGYRSAAYQAAVFERETRRLIAEGIEPEVARREANRFVALPGESEHHLGTAIDFNRIDDDFASTPEARFLAEHGWRYGFLISYPAGAEALTGYIHEPWHLRWVGRPLAAAIHADGYLAGGHWSPGQFTLQDYLDTAQLLLPAEAPGEERGARE